MDGLRLLTKGSLQQSRPRSGIENYYLCAAVNGFRFIEPQVATDGSNWRGFFAASINAGQKEDAIRRLLC